MRCRRLLTPLLLVGATVLIGATPGDARAQTATGDQAAAEALFQDALKLIENQQWAEACPKLEESVRLERAAGAVLNLAACYEQTGKTASAWALFIEGMNAIRRKSPNDPRVAVAQQHADALTAKLSKLSVEVPAEARVAGLVVKRDGTEVGTPQWGTGIPVDPGQHVVEASAPGRETWKVEIKVDARPETVVVKVEPLKVTPGAGGEKPAPGPTMSTSPDRPPPEMISSWSTQKKVALATGAAGAVGLAAGAILGGLAASKNGEMSQFCTDGSPPACNATGMGIAGDVKTFGTSSTIGFIAGGALLAGGVALWLTAPGAPSSKKNTTGNVSIGVTANGMFVKGSF